MTIDKTAIRDAATVIVMRDRDSAPKVLMGQRGAKAAFMPNKFVFPGGAVDAGDSTVPLHRPLPALCRERIEIDARAGIAYPLAAAAIRELWEETGQVLGAPADWAAPPPDWHGFAASGHVPDASALRFVFRALTPPGRPRRFDARFFLVDADALATDPDDFGAASDELSHLQWIELDRIRHFDLPFITEVVLAEVAARAADDSPPASVPFFRNDDEGSTFLQLHGRPMPD
ncbi:DNA mismatch repair protein MutT [Salipiger aestuarii]|uniref:8-oxo-dGTP pyrophosphatase MutT (NUDIX family) n=1 Tax=Salipiger aestuarii TaxID=568098 RepID=A0A327YFN4_9RHOB|nr:NUDIX hydrolase [Salipiger aestuarii]EIE50908.1 NUDIX hydrolase [Citreicella sp. 357]KAA8607412.1 DNA mismatch repair protein MutT [Salipiger aestuarii]KAA8612102.1 DNA mismatch repair protein MutT [Salipiger aestuarii]KAB2541735.1 DNA mismatch repair protein MutT [Salipiger aestuarii]RAK17269.1 8-oxo-dGTP pyrophosphatase MutT (NUDIX family) [Salipiger aestuarii]